MGKKNGEERKSGEGQKAKSAVETIATLIMSGALGDEAKEKVKEVLAGDSNFFSWWQRKPGESVASTNNVLKALGLLVGYEIYDHADPLEGSRVDNAVILLATLALGMLLVVPQSTELGAHFHDFETRVLLAVHDLTPEEREKVMKWIHGLSHKQEARISTMLGKIARDESGKNAFKTILTDEKMRALLRDLAGDDTKAITLEEGIEKVKKVFAIYWPPMKEKLIEADKTTASTFRAIRSFLNAKGVRR